MDTSLIKRTVAKGQADIWWSLQGESKGVVCDNCNASLGRHEGFICKCPPGVGFLLEGRVFSLGDAALLCGSCAEKIDFQRYEGRVESSSKDCQFCEEGQADSSCTFYYLLKKSNFGAGDQAVICLSIPRCPRCKKRSAWVIGGFVLLGFVLAMVAPLVLWWYGFAWWVILIGLFIGGGIGITAAINWAAMALTSPAKSYPPLKKLQELGWEFAG